MNLLLVAVLALFPEFTVVLSAPVVIAGFNALFGMSIAMPIVQSLLRHAQAGGFCDLNDNLAKRSRNTSLCTRTTYSSKL
ncbi:MAG: hypothetical protein V7K69_28930 [Nostoc sp.]|uniref:hypothetical protein n=1 Tax=Nostoc sp. TaxID=1180 RepID=UPI002FF8AC24